MAAPTNAANVKKILANPEPSTHGTFRTCRDSLTMSAHRGILLQKSQKAQRLIFRQRTKQTTIADQ
jgi:hypothetical protein